MNDEVKFFIDEYTFTWDNKKAASNVHKHKISFELAAEVFMDDYAVKIPDDFHSKDEDRYKIIGRTLTPVRIISVIYVERVNLDNVELYRIISAREATRKEKEIYGMGLS